MIKKNSVANSYYFDHSKAEIGKKRYATLKAEHPDWSHKRLFMVTKSLGEKNYAEFLESYRDALLSELDRVQKELEPQAC